MILATTPHDELLGMLDGFEHQLMLAGQTHVQLARMIEGRLVVNPGSVGLPFRGVPFGELQLVSPWAEYALDRKSRTADCRSFSAEPTTTSRRCFAS